MTPGYTALPPVLGSAAPGKRRGPAIADLTLAILHHLLAFALAAILASEIAITRPGLSGQALKRLQRLDRSYGAVAVLLVIFGVLRVLYGGKGPDFYVESHAFWAKMAAFLGVALLSIVPTIRIVRWSRSEAGDAGFALPVDEVRAVRRFYGWQLLLFALIPVFAAMMARG